jgi:processive 1,2-diacylglycerol beta-glucosyltransferase
MIADYKKTFGLGTPLVGVLTDYAPHSYWIYNNIDAYIVPSEETGRRLVDNGIAPERIRPYGIPVHPKFGDSVETEKIFNRFGLSDTLPVILVMGGTQGIGLIKETVLSLNNLGRRLQIAAVAGTNKKLYKWLKKRSTVFRNRVLVFPFTDEIEELMSVSTLIITKPGGITTAEALSKGLPMLILNPLPGQESMNTNYLLREEVAVRADDHNDAAIIVESLLNNKSKLCQMSQRAKEISRAKSAFETARLAMELAQ